MLEKKEESKEIVTTLITNFLVIFLGFYFSFNYRTSNLFKLYGELIIGMGTFVLPKPNLVRRILWISFTNQSIKHSLEQECYPRNTSQNYANVVTFHIMDSNLSKNLRHLSHLKVTKYFIKLVINL